MKKSRAITWVLLIAAVSAAGYYGWQRYSSGQQAAEAAANAQKTARKPVAVTMASVEKADFPVYLLGLGSVQGFNTVLVRTRVDGQIDKIAFKKANWSMRAICSWRSIPAPTRRRWIRPKPRKPRMRPISPTSNLDLQRFTKLGEFATKQQLDTQRSLVQQLTAQIEADDAAISNAQTQFDYTAIKSPIPGVAGLRQVDIGNIVNASAQTGIVTVAQVEPIAVIFTAPERTTAGYHGGSGDPRSQGYRDYDRWQEALGRGERWQ